MNEFNETERLRIGRRIAELRKDRGLSQVQLAERCGMHQGHIARVELGKYSVGIDTLVNIAEALGCEIDITKK